MVSRTNEFMNGGNGGHPDVTLTAVLVTWSQTGVHLVSFIFLHLKFIFYMFRGLRGNFTGFSSAEPICDAGFLGPRDVPGR